MSNGPSQTPNIGDRIVLGALRAYEAWRGLEKPPPPPPPANMDSAQQHSFLNPTTYFTVTCVAFSLLALSSVWRNHQAPAARVERESPRPKPPRRRAVDSLYVSDGPFRHIDGELENSAGTSSQLLSGLIGLVASVAQQIRSSQDGSTDRLTVATLLSELANLTTSLCRLQQESVNFEFSRNESLSVCLQTTLLGLRETLLFAQTTISNPSLRSGSTLTTVIQQLRDHRPTLGFLLESLAVKTSLPPTPPCDADSEVSLKGYPPSGSSLLPPPMPTGLTPAMDTKAWIEPPPEYSPPSASSNVVLQMEKAEHKIEVPRPRESSSSDSSDNGDTENDHDVYDAVTANDLPTLTHLLADCNPNPNATFGEHNRSALHQAAHLNHAQLIPPLLRAGSLLTTEDAAGDTPLHLAAWAGHVEALTALLTHTNTADVDFLSGRDAYSALWCAVTAAHIDAARVLLRHGARVSLRNAGGMTLLHQAAVMGQGAMVEMLLDRGAHVDAVDDEGNAALHYAATSGSAPCVSALLRARADVEMRQAQGLTAAHWAAHKGHLEVLGLLLASGADVNAVAGEGATPLHMAANRGHLAVVRLLLEKGAKTGVKGSWDGVEGTARQMARAKGHGSVVKAIEAARKG